MKYSFEIKERAVGKERPRYSAKSGRMYTPTKTSSFEEKVRVAFKSKYNIALEPSTREFKVKITAYFKPAESLSKKKKQELIDGEFGFLHRPDADNVAKAILDALNGLAYKDDSQVANLLIFKLYGEENKILVEMEEIN